MNIPFNIYGYYLYFAIYYVFILFFDQTNSETVDQCCRRQKVPDICVKTLCYPLKPPGDFDIYDVFERRNDCSKYLKQIGQCLANGRDHSACCAKEAKDRDESACFGLCRGEGHKHTTKTLHATHQSWTSYQTCLAINLPSMLSCFEKGYQNTPSPPQQLQVKQIDSQQVELSWIAPELNANLVEHYLIVVNRVDNEISYDNDNSEDDENSIEETIEDLSENMSNERKEKSQRRRTKSTHLVLNSLEPGTDYTAYAIAIATNGAGQSLSTDFIRFQTTGVAPIVEAFKPRVFVVPNATSALLACRFQISGSVSTPPNLPNLEWKHKKSASETWETIRGFRFNQTYFVYSTGRPRQLIMTLEIYDFNHDADYGNYECRVEDEFGVGSAEVELRAAILEAASKAPPPTPLACCKERNIQNRCLAMCGGSAEGAETKRYMPRPFMPLNCSKEISKVLSCAMPEVDDSQCCLKERVPRQCMYLCDSSIEPSNKMSAVCLEHVNSVEQCRISGVEVSVLYVLHYIFSEKAIYCSRFACSKFRNK